MTFSMQRYGNMKCWMRMLIGSAGAALLSWPLTAKANTTYSYPGSTCRPADWDFLDTSSEGGDSFATGYNLGTLGNWGYITYNTYNDLALEHYGKLQCSVVKHAGNSYIKEIAIAWAPGVISCDVHRYTAAGVEITGGVSYPSSDGLTFAFSNDATAVYYRFWCTDMGDDGDSADDYATPFEDAGIQGVQVVEGN